MTLTKKLALWFFVFWFSGVATALSIFWLADLPQSAVVRILAFDPESAGSTIRNLCTEYSAPGK
jgi:hypothetical protein